MMDFLGIEKSYICIPVRTVAQETASQITLGNCSVESFFFFFLNSNITYRSTEHTSNVTGVYSFKFPKERSLVNIE